MLVYSSAVDVDGVLNLATSTNPSKSGIDMHLQVMKLNAAYDQSILHVWVHVCITVHWMHWLWTRAQTHPDSGFSCLCELSIYILRLHNLQMHIRTGFEWVIASIYECPKVTMRIGILILAENVYISNMRWVEYCTWPTQRILTRQSPFQVRRWPIGLHPNSRKECSLKYGHIYRRASVA